FTGSVSVAGALFISGAGIQRSGTPTGTFFGTTPEGHWIARGGSLALTNFSGSVTYASLSSSGIFRQGNKVWDAGNDGSGSGLDADLLDGQQGSYYLPASSYTAADVRAKLLTVDG